MKLNRAILLVVFIAIPLASESAIVISNGTFYQDGRPVFYTGPFMYWEEDTQYDRRGAWSSDRRYAEVIDKTMCEDLGFNTWHPINFMSYFIMKKHYPSMLTKFTERGVEDYFGSAERVAKNVIGRMSDMPVMLEYSDMGLHLGFGARARKNLPADHFQKSKWWCDFFPLDPSYPKSMELYKTMFHDATKFVIDNGAKPFLYELVNEPFYNSFSPENITLFVSYLKKKHSIIDAANKAWGTSHASFDAAAASVESVQDNDRGLWYDWMYFQSELLAGYLREFKNTVLSADKRPVPKYFSLQPMHQVPVMAYNTAYNYTWSDFLDVIGVEYTGIHFSIGSKKSFDGKDMMEAGFGVGNRTMFTGAALARAYAKGRPVVDFEMRTCRYVNGVRVPSWEHDFETTLWHQAFAGHSGSIVYTWGHRGWEWKTYEEAKKSAQSAGYKEAYLLNPYNYPPEALLGLKRFREEMDRLADIVLPSTRVKADVGVLVIDHQTWQLKGREYEAYASAYESLRRMQMPFDFIIAEMTKAEELARYRVVICPAAEFAPASVRRMLLSYAGNGGVIIASPNAFTMNEYGRPLDPSEITGLAFEKASGVDSVVFPDGLADAVFTGRYAHAVSARAPKAEAFATWTSGGTAVYAHTIGKGKVYTPMFSSGDNTLAGAYAALLKTAGVKRSFAVFDGNVIDTGVTIDVIDRGDAILACIINWGAVSKTAALKMRVGNRAWHVCDGVSGDRYISAGDTWSAEDLASGITLTLPAQERVLILVSAKKRAWGGGVITDVSVRERTAQLIMKNNAYLASLEEKPKGNTASIPDPFPGDPVIAGPSLVGFEAVAFNVGTLTASVGTEDPCVITVPSDGKNQWGGVNIRGKNGRGLQLPDGVWRMVYEINFTGVDEFGKPLPPPGVQITAVTDTKQKNQARLMMPIDGDASTWQRMTHGEFTGPAEVREVLFQYGGKNPPQGILLRNIYFIKKNNP
ncbi:MAG: hypothetical protein AABZ39_13515 [Spirochaetota bacterium]